MESISNYRDAALSGMKNGLLFRSAALDNATRGDIETILKKYCITTVVDLRGRF
jgi:protein tyrosine/serine phosphatase